MVDTARNSRGTTALEQVMKAAILCAKYTQKILIFKSVLSLSFINAIVFVIFSGRTPSLDEQLIADIANFYTEFLVYYHVTLESDLDTKTIDNLFSEFYIQHQDIIRSRQLKFYLEHPDYIDFKPVIFVNLKYY